MISRPTTEQILLDCRTELLDTIAPAVSAEPVRIAIEMMENVLRNCAARAAHEIAWMREETDAMIAFARSVVEQLGDTGRDTGQVAEALAAFEAGRCDSLHLDDVTATYSLAGHCFGLALEATMAAGDDRLHRAGRDVLDLRLAHENEIMGEWAFVGRA